MRFWFLIVLTLFGGCAGGATRERHPNSVPEQAVVAVDPSQWRGFNLLNMFWKDWKEGPFQENDFKWLREFGFNYARLALDYRIWTAADDWSRFDEAKLKWLDDAVQLGQKHRIHVSLALHRAPGYTSADKDPEVKNLWKDSDAQEAFVRQWKLFASRFKGISGSELSFNLLNEPESADPEIVEKVFRTTCEAIWAIDPKRPIIVDGTEWGAKPLKGLYDLPVVQAARGYAPKQLAGWNPKKVDFLPNWPLLRLSPFIHGSEKPALQSPLIISGAIPPKSVLRLEVGHVSRFADVHIRADGKEVWTKEFKPGPGAGEWSEVIFKPEWGIYQNRYDREYAVELPRGARSIEISVAEGDWVTFKRIGIDARRSKRAWAAELIPTDKNQKSKQVTVHLDSHGRVNLARSPVFDRHWLFETQISPWQEPEKHGVKVFVEEFGVNNRVPHPVALAWMEDRLRGWKEANWGWAVWELYGEHGILDSGRADVQYEDFNGHKLDRKMLQLLQRFQ